MSPMVPNGIRILCGGWLNALQTCGSLYRTCLETKVTNKFEISLFGRFLDFDKRYNCTNFDG